MLTAAAYIRVSDDKQEEYSPDSQLKLIRDYAAKSGYFLPEEYIFSDEGISGKSTKHRDSFNQMISLAKSKEKPIDAILVWKFSRFARNQEQSIVYKSLLARQGVAVVSISEPIIDGPFGKLIERIIEWMDEYYLIRLSGEVKRGMKEKASRGEAMCHPAFGYDLKGKTYIPNSDAPIVRRIFDAYINGEGFLPIAAKLAANGVKTYRGGNPNNRWIEYILNNPVYIGKIRWSLDGRAASKRDYHNPDIMIVDGAHEPIITIDTWEKAQSLLTANKRRYGPYQRRDQPVDWMLKGLVRCGTCGATLTYSALSCPSMQCYKYAHGQCKVSHSLSISKANRIFIQTLEYTIESKVFRLDPDFKLRQEESPDYQKQLEAEQRKLEKIKKAYYEGADTVEEYKKNKSAVLASIEEICAKMQKPKNKPKFDAVAYAKKVSAVLEFIKKKDVSEKEKSIALHGIISKIMLNKPENTFDIYFYS